LEHKQTYSKAYSIIAGHRNLKTIIIRSNILSTM